MGAREEAHFHDEDSTELSRGVIKRYFMRSRWLSPPEQITYEEAVNLVRDRREVILPTTHLVESYSASLTRITRGVIGKIRKSLYLNSDSALVGNVGLLVAISGILIAIFTGEVIIGLSLILGGFVIIFTPLMSGTLLVRSVARAEQILEDSASVHIYQDARGCTLLLTVRGERLNVSFHKADFEKIPELLTRFKELLEVEASTEVIVSELKGIIAKKAPE